MDSNKYHLEDFDSKQGDIEKGSLAATQSNTEPSRQSTQIDEGIQRGVLNAQQHNTLSCKSPGEFMDMLEGGGYSVTTGKMNDLMDDVTMGMNDLEDDVTFDGSTIVSANDITHKKLQGQHQVVQFPNQESNGNNQIPPIKPVASRGTGSTYSSDKSRRSEQSTAGAICCGLGRLGIILLSVGMTSVALAFILWLTLGYLPQQGGSSPSSACCKGNFELAWSGREICNAEDSCCVVCASSVEQDGDNVVLGVEDEATQPPKTPEPTPATTTQPPKTPEPTPATTTAEPMETQAQTSEPEETQAQTSEPEETPVQASEPADTGGTGTDTGPEPVPEPGPDTGPEPGPDTGPEPGPDTGPGTRPDTGPGTGPSDLGP